MAHIEWDDSFNINIEAIDSQHKTWVNTINDLDDILYHGDSNKIIEKTMMAIKAMWEYTRFHFKTEETYMKSINYPGFLQHQAIHDKFCLDVLEIYNDMREGKQVLSTDVIRMMTKWLSEHILHEDKKIKLYLSK
jgi:hemerythrin